MKPEGSARLGQPVRRDEMAETGLLQAQGLLAQQVALDRQESVDLQERLLQLAQQAQPVILDIRAHKAKSAQKAIQDRRDRKAQQGQKVTKVKKGTLVPTEIVLQRTFYHSLPYLLLLLLLVVQ